MKLADMVKQMDEDGDDMKLTNWERKFVGDMLDKLVMADYDDDDFEALLFVKEKAKITQIHGDRS